MQFGVREVTAAQVARVLGMMARTHSGLTDGIPLQVSGLGGAGGGRMCFFNWKLRLAFIIQHLSFCSAINVCNALLSEGFLELCNWCHYQAEPLFLVVVKRVLVVSDFWDLVFFS